MGITCPCDGFACPDCRPPAWSADIYMEGGASLSSALDDAESLVARSARSAPEHRMIARPNLDDRE